MGTSCGSPAGSTREGSALSGHSLGGWAAFLTTAIFDTDHAFADHRIALARVIVDWLATKLD